jgi:hypothetical protein
MSYVRLRTSHEDEETRSGENQSRKRSYEG